MEKGELEAELAHANQRIESLEHHADALMRHGSTQPTSSLDHDHALCGVGGTFQKSGGGFLVTGLDGGMDAMAGVSNNIPGNLKMGDLAIAMDDIPLADMSSIQFRNSIQVALHARTHTNACTRHLQHARARTRTFSS
jgi:hypothetical protein